MVQMPDFTEATLDAVNAALVRIATEQKRNRGYLGFSQIGDECERKLWYEANGYEGIPPDVLSLRRFEDGHRGEALMAERLRLVPGIELHTHDESGNQFGFTDFNNRFKGHMDGAIHGILEAPETWHVWEHKQVDEKKFNELKKLKEAVGEKKALEKWDYTYYCQGVLYMEYSQMKRHFLTVATPGGRLYTSCRTEANPTLASTLRTKAHRILSAASPPNRISTTAAFFKCKWCQHRDNCWKGSSQ